MEPPSPHPCLLHGSKDALSSPSGPPAAQSAPLVPQPSVPCTQRVPRQDRSTPHTARSCPIPVLLGSRPWHLEAWTVLRWHLPGGGGMSSLVRRLHMCAWGPISECDTYTWRHATSVCHIPWGAHVGHVAHVAHPGSSVFAFVVSESFVGRCGGRAGGLVPDYFCFGLLVSCREEARFPLHLPVHT